MKNQDYQRRIALQRQFFLNRTRQKPSAAWVWRAMIIVGCLLTPLGFASDLPDFATVFEKGSPSVATLIVSKHFQQNEGATALPDVSDDSDLKNFFHKHFGEAAQRSTFFGSAFVADADGYLFTSAHLVTDAAKIWIVLEGKKRYRAKLIIDDSDNDIALLKIKAKTLPVPRFGKSSSLRVGEWVMAIGSPFGFEKSASQGIISGLNRKLHNKE
ncbi:MAG: hypothetical protein GKR96_08610 [Gammaproteobacteria bacterium]|nr:hypothetical protein [Gammaproteobacteria bacterium]